MQKQSGPVYVGIDNGEIVLSISADGKKIDYEVCITHGQAFDLFLVLARKIKEIGMGSSVFLAKNPIKAAKGKRR
jgi:hypothetical protein